MTGPGSFLSFSPESTALSNSQSSSPLPLNDSLLNSVSSPDLHAEYVSPLTRSSKSHKRGNIPSNFFNSINTGEGLPTIETTEPSLLNSPGRIRKISSPRKLVLETSLDIKQSSGNSESPQRERKISSPRKFKHLELIKDDKHNRLSSVEEKLESPRLSPRKVSTPPSNHVEPVRGRKSSQKKSTNTLGIDEEGPSRSPSPGIEKSERLSPRSSESKSPRRKRNTLGAEITPTSTQQKRSQYSSQRSAVEIKSKKTDLSHLLRHRRKESMDSSLTTFRDEDLKKIRENSISSSIEAHVKKQIKVKKFNDLTLHKDPRKIDKTFMKKMRELESTFSFSDERLQEIVDRILRKEINGLIQRQFIPDGDRVKDSKQDLLTIVQNTLLFSTNFFNRLNRCHELLIDHALEKKYTTSFLNSLHFFLNNLTLVKSIEDKKCLLNWGVGIPDFLNCLEFMKKTKCISEDVKNVVTSVFGPSKNSILAFLNEWNLPTSSSIPALLESKINEITEKNIKLRKVTSYEHIWEEPVDHKYENEVLPPFDQIPLVDVINYYFREEAIEIPIFINGEPLFDNAEMGALLKADRSKYFFNLFSKLLTALGYKARKKNTLQPSLEEEVETLLKYIHSERLPDGGKALNVEERRVLEAIMFTPEIRQCFDLLKLGGIESWARAEYYINQRYGLFDDITVKDIKYPLEIRKTKNEGLNFQIKENFVEQKRAMIFNIRYQRDTKADMLVSWKVHLPLNNSFRCVFRPIEISINNQGGDQILEEIQNHLIDFGSDEVIRQKLAVGSIKIYSFLNNALVKDTKGVTLF